MNVDAPGVAVSVHARGWEARWPGTDLELRATEDAGDWRVERGDAFGRSGRWVTGTGAGHLSVHVPDEGGVLTVKHARRENGRLVALDSVVTLDASRTVRLVNGYQSWDYSGVRRGDERGHTWWGGALADPGRGGVAFHAATARRFATSFSTRPGADGIRLLAHEGGSPDLLPVAGSWGFRTTTATALDLEAVGTSEAEPVLVAAGADPLVAMEEVANAVALASGASGWDGFPVLGWESWYHYGFSITPDALFVNARIMRERFPERFSLVQLDDGWQRSYGDWRSGAGWPDDLGELTAGLRELGCRTGLWLAPFMVWPDGPGVGERPELLATRPEDGEPVKDPLMARHAVDGTHPDALQWLHDLGSRVRRWGVEMVKLDFLYLGALEARRHDPGATGTEALRRGLAAFLEGLGPDVYVLGCGMPMLPAVGLCHANRVGGDLAAPIVWPFPELVPFDPSQGWRGILPQARNVAARWWTHRRLFHNDPEVVLAAGPAEGPPYSLDEARVQASVAALSGGPFLLADDLASLPDVKRGVVEDPELLELAWGEGFRPVDLFDHFDEAPDPEFFSLPTDLAGRWHEGVERAGAVRARFDWTKRSVDLVHDH